MQAGRGKFGDEDEAAREHAKEESHKCPITEQVLQDGLNDYFREMQETWETSKYDSPVSLKEQIMIEKLSSKTLTKQH
jgi:hypothetical protein